MIIHNNNHSNTNHTEFSHIINYIDQESDDNEEYFSHFKDADSPAPITVYRPDPTLRVLNNASQSNLREFFYHTFDSCLVNLNVGFINDLENFLNPVDIHWMNILTQYSAPISLNISERLPLYQGSALDLTTLRSKRKTALFSDPNFDHFKLQWHLLKLFFTYYNPFLFIIHPISFYRKVLSNEQSDSFQMVVLLVLSIATGYLHLEPYDGAPHPSELAQSYLNDALSLYEVEQHKPSIYIIQSSILLSNCNYARTQNNFDFCWVNAQKMGWIEKFTKSTEEILSFMPGSKDEGPVSSKYLVWEEELLVWCSIIFNSALMLMGRFPIPTIDALGELPDINNALTALYSGSRYPCYCDYEEATILYQTYSLVPIMSEVLSMCKILYHHYPEGAYPSARDHYRMVEIRNRLNDWLHKSHTAQVNIPMTSRRAALIANSQTYYHLIIIYLSVPFLPTPCKYSDQVSFLAQHIDHEVVVSMLSSCYSISLLAASQKSMFTLFGCGAKNYVLFVVWSGIQIVSTLLDQISNSQSRLQDQNVSQSSLIHITQLTSHKSLESANQIPLSISKFRFLVNMCQALITIPMNILTQSITFSFHHQPNHIILQKQAAIFWTMMRGDHKGLLDTFDISTKAKSTNGEKFLFELI